MAPDGCRCSSAVAACVTMTSLAVCATGLFLKKWWIEWPSNYEFGLFTPVKCVDDLCVMGYSETAGWIVFAQALGIVQFSMLIVSVVAQVLACICNHRLTCLISAVFLAVACGSAMLQIFVTVTKYRHLTDAYEHSFQKPIGLVLYQTLPVGLFAVSGILALVAGVALLIWLIERDIQLHGRKASVI